MQKDNLENVFSKENLIKCLNGDDKVKQAAAESFLGVCKYPEDYWVMPDYYYPGLSTAILRIQDLLENSLTKTNYCFTSNDCVLMNESLIKDKKSDKIFHGVKDLDGYNSNPKNIDILSFNDDETVTFTDLSGQTVTVPWGILCGVFLKARELGYSRPDSLDAAGPYDQETRKKWLTNQEKIKELQSKIDE